MKNTLLSKLLAMGALLLLAAIPLSMVAGIVSQRASYRDSATQEVANAHAREQTVTGPILYWPYAHTIKVEKNQVSETKSHALVYAMSLHTHSKLHTQTRWRGIFPVTVYSSTHTVQGRFRLDQKKISHAVGTEGRLAIGQPWLLLSVSDMRGITGAAKLRVGGTVINLDQALKNPVFNNALGIAIDPAWLDSDQTFHFTLEYELAGTGSMAWVPLGDENTVEVKSNWPHPSFGGDFLPRERNISEQGFSAKWNVNKLASTAQKNLESKLDESSKSKLEKFSVTLKTPADLYHQTERAVKYGLMFVALTFAAFFVFEMVKRWRIHPMQYLMVAAALIVFFLLLLSLSEQIGFYPAYALASCACIGLLAYYLRYVLGDWLRSLSMAAMLSALYGALYCILVSEDNALLMGSLLLFVVLGLMMVATRRIDWYTIMKPPTPSDMGVQSPQTEGQVSEA